MKKVSIVIPLYNVQNSIERTINSIFKQDYDNWEIILVDDGSPDDSGKIADKMSEEYPDKIISVHQKNAGQGGARNTGIKYATGDYLTFVDGDDEIEPNHLSVCVSRMDKDNLDVLAFEYSLVKDNGEKIKDVVSPFAFSQTGNIKKNKSYLLIQGMPWNKMFRTQFLKESGIVFREKIRYEDLLFCTELLLNVKRIGYINLPLYRYYLSANSAMRNTDIDRNREIFFVLDEIIKFYKEHNAFEEYYDELCYLTIDNIYIASSLRIIRINHKLSIVNEFREYLKKSFPDYRKNKYIKRMSKQYRLTYFLLELRCLWLIRLLTKIKNRRNK